MYIFRVKFTSGDEEEFSLSGACVSDSAMLHIGLDEAIRLAAKQETMVDTFEVIAF